MDATGPLVGQHRVINGNSNKITIPAMTREMIAQIHPNLEIRNYTCWQKTKRDDTSGDQNYKCYDCQPLCINGVEARFKFVD
jgi:hypothetical protein